MANTNTGGSSKGLGDAANGYGNLFEGTYTGNLNQAGNGLTGMAQGVGGQFQNISDAFTPLNQFQATNAPITQQQFGAPINSSLQSFGQNYANQNALAGQLQNQAQGFGPNPAQQMLNQSTNQNIHQNAGMIASQKGLNPALAQRMAAQNAGNMNQQAAGQGALMNAQQQLAAQQGLGGLYNQMGNQQLGLQSTLQNAQAAQNNALVTNQGNVNAVNAGVAAGNAKARQGGIMGMAGAIPSVAAMFSQGGMVHGYADGGEIPLSNWGYQMQPMGDSSGAMSQAGQYLNSDDSKGGSPLSSLTSMFKSGGGGGMSQGGGVGFAANGGNVPGKAQVSGDNPKNDTVPAVLSPGEVVIPRSVMNSKDAPANAAKFVAAIMAKKGLKKRIA